MCVSRYSSLVWLLWNHFQLYVLHLAWSTSTPSFHSGSSLKQDQQSRHTADQHNDDAAPVPLSTAVQPDLWYCVADEAGVAGQSGVDAWPVSMSTAQSKTHHPSLYPGPVHHLADQRPSWITLGKKPHTDSLSFHHWEVSKCRKQVIQVISNAASCFAYNCDSRQSRSTQMMQQYLAGVLSALLVSSTDHVIEDVHRLRRARLVHLLTRSLRDDWHLHFLQSPHSLQRDWVGYKNRWRMKKKRREGLEFLRLNRWSVNSIIWCERVTAYYLCLV